MSRWVGTRRAEDTYVCPEDRRAAIRQFSESHINTARLCFRDGRLIPGTVERYDQVIVGSDQVWNPAFTHGNPEWFLSFVLEQQRIAYAASIGIPSVPRYLRGRYRNGLKSIPALSVREFEAAKVIRELTGREVPVVLDPTMLLDADTWASLAQYPTGLEPDGYIATFMLSAGDSGSVGGPGTDLSSVQAYSRKHGLPIVDLHDPANPELVAMGPLEFIGAIRGAALVVTDSFHAAVFSTLFHRPFLLAQRGVMSSRFDTLLRHTGLSRRMLAETGSVEQAVEIDWTECERRVERQREESRKFLTNTMQE